MASRALPVSKLKARRRRLRVIWASVVLGFTLAILVGVVGFSWTPYARINTVEVVGASSVDAAAVQDTVLKATRGTYGYVFAKNNIFLYPRENIEKGLLASYPVFGEVEIQHSGLHTLVVAITERTAVALWCGESVASSSACFLLDSSGVSYTPAADFSGQTYVKYYGHVSNVPPQFVTPPQFKEIYATAEALRTQARGETPTQVEVKNTEVHITFESGFKLFYSSLDNGASVLERLSLAMQAEPFVTKKLFDFEYLDLRFGDKLYYKLKAQ